MANQFLVKETMAAMRGLSAAEITALQAGTYDGVQLLGYHKKGDTPAPIIYYYVNPLTDPDPGPDDGGSIVAVGGVKLEHRFVGMVSLKYFGIHDGSANDTVRVNNAVSAVERYKAEGYIVPYTTNPIMIDGVSQAVPGNNNTRGIIQKSNQIVCFEEGARFKIIPNSSGGYAGWNFYKVENVKIVNGYIIGDADVHIAPNNNIWKRWESLTPFNVGDYIYIHRMGFKVNQAGVSSAVRPFYKAKSLTVGTILENGSLKLEVVNNDLGEWGHCIEVTDCKNIDFHNFRADKAWGDGIYLGNEVGNTDRTKHNTNVSLLGKTYFESCRRQGISVISCNNFYAQYLEGYDIKGADPEAVIDFEPNSSTQTISGVIDNITAVKCGYSALFASQSNELKIRIGSIQNIDSFLTGALHFQGLGHVSENPENYVHVGSYYANKCHAAPVQLSNWFEGYQSSVRVDNILIEEWSPDGDGETSIVYFKNILKDQQGNLLALNKPITNIDIKNFGFNKRIFATGAIFRPFMMYAEMLMSPNNYLNNINIDYNYFDYDAIEDGQSSFTVNNNSVRTSIKTATTATASLKTSLASQSIKSGDILYTTAPSTTLRVLRRGFTEAIVVNSYQAADAATFILNLGSQSGFTEVEAIGITVTANTFTLRYGAVFKLQRMSDSKLRITMLYYGSKNINNISLIGTPSGTNLLDIASDTVYGNSDVFLHWDSSRANLVNYPPNGRGSIIQYTDSSTGAKTFLAFGYNGGNAIFYLGNKVGSVVNWVNMMQTATTSLKGMVNQAAALPNIIHPDLSNTTASDVAGLSAWINTNLVPLVNAIKTSQNDELSNQRTAGQQAI